MYMDRHGHELNDEQVPGGLSANRKLVPQSGISSGFPVIRELRAKHPSLSGLDSNCGQSAIE